MLEKMKAIEARLAEVERQLSDPTVYTDRERFTAPQPRAEGADTHRGLRQSLCPGGADGGGRLRHAVGP